MKRPFLCIVSVVLGIFCSAQCDEIKVSKDKFTDVLSRSTPILLKKASDTIGVNLTQFAGAIVSPVIFSFLSNGPTYTLTLMVKGQTSYSYYKGAYILLKNGSKLIFPDADVTDESIGNSTSHYMASVFIQESDVKLLKSHPITDIKVGVYECSLAPWLGEKIKTYVACAAN